MASRIRAGDSVVVLTGKDRGKTGKVRTVLPKESRVIIEGVNIVKRHTKARGPGQPGGIIEKEAALHISNVAIADPSGGKPTRVGFRVESDGSKVRVARASGQVIPDVKPGGR
jgi:large subunit ribosomal protein L24